MRVPRAIGRAGIGLIALGAAFAAGTATAGSTEPAPIELHAAVWSAGVADSMLLAEPELSENPFAVLVRFAPDADGDLVDATLAPIAGRVVDAHVVDDGATVHVVETRAGIDAALLHLRRSPFVVAAEPDRVVVVDALTDDTHIGRLWGLDGSAGVGIESAWADSVDATTVVVGVIDSGVQTDHPDLASVMWTNPGEIPDNGIDDDANGKIDDVHGWDWVDDDADPGDPNGHGTHVAGTIGAVQGNALGVAGVATNVEIMALRFLNAQGSGYTSDAIAALTYALDHDVVITNNSWGGGSYSWTLSNLIGGATDHLFVAAAGNSALDLDVGPRYPAGYSASNILSVASHDSDADRSSFSNHGLTLVDVSAPGRSIYSTLPDDRYGWKSGTSMATPHVAGVAALIVGIDPTVTPVEVIDLIERTSRWDDASIIGTTRSGGHLDAGRAVLAAQPTAPSIDIDATEASALIGTPIALAVEAEDVDGGDLGDDVVWYVESLDGAFDGAAMATGADFAITVSEPTRIRIRAEVTDGSGNWNVDTRVISVVAGAPSAPLAVQVEAGDSLIGVSWTSPEDDGGADIDGYTATASPGGASCVATGTSCLIFGVGNGIEYTVSVVAHNTAGASSASAASEPVVPVTTPGIPQAITAVGGDESVSISWAPPLDDGGTPVTGYEVLIAPSGLGCVTTDTTCVIEGLVNGDSYEVFVWAVNAVGSSAPGSGGAVVPEPDHIRCEATVASSSFVDLPATSFAVADVECLRVLGITNGTSSTTYSPGERVTREQMAAFLARLYRQVSGDLCAPDGSSFADLASTSFARADVECLRELGITNGTSATTYSPGVSVTREQMAAFLARLYREITGEACAPSTSTFDDVAGWSFARTDVECLVALGITNGTSATTYSPGAEVSREQMAAFLGRLYRAITA
ncbi:MAG: S8 family serine peptidase [Actinomycetota bacterium]